VVLELKNIENGSSLPGVDRNFGKIVEKVDVSREGKTVRYHFILKWDVSPLVGKLAPQANYTHHRIYLDFLNSRINGATRSEAERNSGRTGVVSAEGADKKENGKDPAVRDVRPVSPVSSGKNETVSKENIKVLTPDEARLKKEQLHEANMRHMEEQERAEAEARRKAEAEAKRKAEARAKAEADAKRKAEAEEKRKAEARAKAEADAKRKAEAEEKRKAEARAKAEADAKRKAEAEEKRKAEARAKAEADAKHKTEEEGQIKGRCKKRKVVIAIDPGHGGKDPGASGPSGHKEKNVTLSISRRLAKLINATSDMKAVMIRNSDIFVDLDMRSEKARKANADILISIHADAAANKSARGASVLVLNNDRAGRENQKMSNSESKHSLLLGGASEVLEETAANGESNEYMKNMIIDLTSGKSRDSGYDLANRIITYFSKFATLHKYRPDERSLAVLKAPDIPSILVETGFISNEREEKLLTSADHQKKIANAIFQSIRDHLRDPRYRVENCR
jgi:N-acetylmuramoyl-L-alanine amidase